MMTLSARLFGSTSLVSILVPGILFVALCGLSGIVRAQEEDCVGEWQERSVTEEAGYTQTATGSIFRTMSTSRR